ncbi:hypothetical protein [Tabrizicola sp.]|uniref:hypothetical protein n=1 Tax=Tabrizicola sp. TaxID=2005166 RepID=UPI00273265C8|nr:hypothetical protein [Tabrizicola sp.]MDP3193790.1 hypothetical protein [Tabrizicola sp.]
MISADPPRKSSQEVELDHLLAEEFACDPGFIIRFLAACQLDSDLGSVRRVVAEPSLGGNGFGDLLVELERDDRRVALLIEDKITASPAARQAERYREYAAMLKDDGWDQVLCVVVAPQAWRGDRDGYDAHLALEELSGLLESADPGRLGWRRAIINRALQKHRTSGVKLPDSRVLAFKTAYLETANDWASRNKVPLLFPVLKTAYYDGDSWVEPILHPALPQRCKIRHRCWTSVRTGTGLVDLIVLGATPEEAALLTGKRASDSLVSSFSGGKGISVSLPVAELRPTSTFHVETLEESLRKMVSLVDWFVSMNIG